jgi:uncharacterized protein (DUF58 family)
MNLLMSLLNKFKEQWKKVIFLEKNPEAGEVTLTQRRVFTLPNKAGLMYGFALIIFFVTSINYNLNLGLAITYLLAGIFVINTFYSFRNLAYLTLSAGSSNPIFAGDAAQFILHINNPKPLARFAILIGFNKDSSSEQSIDIEAHSQVTVKINQQSIKRGTMNIPRLCLQTSFPLGILRAWSTWLPDTQVLVYPAPELNAPALPFIGESNNEGTTSIGDEDFAGVRSYQQGDPLKHLSWKHIARVDLDAGGSLVSKQFSGGAVGEVHIDFAHLSHMLDLELRLSRMTSWVLEADKKGYPYSFYLGSVHYSSNSSEAHKVACLTALANYPHEGKSHA